MKRFLRISILAVMKLLPPIIGLRFLLSIDNWIYYLLGQQAINYNRGIHPKHRLTFYHDFFIERIQPSDRVIDIGCGKGAVTIDIAERAEANVTGIDINPKHIELAIQKHQHPNAQFLCADIRRDKFYGEFDVIVLSNVLEHLDDRSSLLRKIQMNFHPSRWLIRVPLFERDWRVPLKKELGVEWRLDPTHEIEYSLETFTQEIQESGLQIHYMEVRWGEIWADVRVK